MSRGCLASVFVLLVAVVPALADRGADPRRQAGELAAKSAQHYKRGEFEEAAKLLREAYAQYPEPNLLYNLARSLESAGDREGALEAYEKFLATAKKIEDRAAIERRVTTLKAELAEKQRAEEKRRSEAKQEQAPPTTTAAPSETAIVEPPPPPPESKRSRTIPIAIIASGAAIIAVGGVLGVRANQQHDQALAAMTGVDAQMRQDGAQRDALVANILFGVGGAVMITGVVLVW